MGARLCSPEEEEPGTLHVLESEEDVSGAFHALSEVEEARADPAESSDELIESASDRSLPGFRLEDVDADDVFANMHSAGASSSAAPKPRQRQSKLANLVPDPKRSLR